MRDIPCGNKIKKIKSILQGKKNWNEKFVTKINSDKTFKNEHDIIFTGLFNIIAS